MICCAASSNGCFDLRRRAFELDRQVSAECSKCPSCMTRRVEIVWLHCDEAQQVGCLRGLEGRPLVQDAGIQSLFARRR